MRASDIFGIVMIALVAFLVGLFVGNVNTIPKERHEKTLNDYKAAIDSYRDYVISVEKSTNIPSNPALELLRTNIENNVICDLPSKEGYQVMNTYKSYQ